MIALRGVSKRFGGAVALDGEQLDQLRGAAETCRISRALAVPVTLRVRLAAT